MSQKYDLTQRAYLDLVASGQDTTAIEAIMDAQDAAHHDQLTGPGALLSAALWYAEVVHCPVFPLQPLGKKPLVGSHGLNDATTNPDQISTWWTTNPTYNIGLATGHTFDVIDFDGPEGIAYGYMNPDLWPEIIGKGCTPRPGGNHWYVKPTGGGNRAGMLPHIDYRGKGGYVVAPPSRTDDRPGQVAGTYEWLIPIRAAS